MPGPGQRDYAKERCWRKLFADWEISALSAAEYCRQHNIKYTQFQDWRKTLAHRSAEVEAKTAKLQREHREKIAAAQKEAQAAERKKPQSPPGRNGKAEENSELLTRQEAAKYLGLAAQTPAVWRTTGRYPLPSVKVGRLVRYRRSDLNAFLAARTSNGSASASPAIDFAEVRVVDHVREPEQVLHKEVGLLELSIPGGMTLRIGAGCSMDLLASVIALLGGR